MAKKRHRLSAEESKDRIIEAAIELFAKHGFLETSFQMIADHCDWSQSAVIHHFPSKDLLVDSVIQTILKHNHEHVASLIQVEDNASDRLEKHFIGNLAWAFRYAGEAQVLLLLYYLASFNKKFAKTYSQILVRARARIKEHLLAGVREGIFHPDLRPDEAAELLHDALLGGVVNLLSIKKVEPNLPDPKKKWDYLIHFYRTQ